FSNSLEFTMRKHLSSTVFIGGAVSSVLSLLPASSHGQTALPQVDVTVASPIARRAPARPAPAPARAPASAPTEPAPAPVAEAPQPGTLPVVTDQFATVTVVPN